PGQKILEARRQMALAELSRPAYAALLYGWLDGRAPAATEELIRAKLLLPSELAHAGGEPIRFTPGQAPRSSWGTPAALTPLIDLPAPALVSAGERDAYAAFVRGYQMNWSTYIDPIAVRVSLTSGLSVDVRVLPLIEGTDYRKI